MTDLREDFVKYVVKQLVANPDAVVVERAHDDRGDFLRLSVDPDDMGKVIGRAGATAKSIRTLLRALGTKDNLEPLPLKIVDPEDGDAQDIDEVAEETTEAPQEDHTDEYEKQKKELEELADF